MKLKSLKIFLSTCSFATLSTLYGHGYLKIDGIEKDELVCMHKKPDHTSPAVAAIPYGARCLENLALFPHKAIPPGAELWHRVAFFGKKGWIPASRSTEDDNCTFAPDADETQKVLITALGKTGSPYRVAKSGPDSFDCSGFVYYVFKKAGISIPRTAKAQSESGDPLKRGELKAGDMIFFDTSGRGHVNHSGIYLGSGRFIHATSGKAFMVTISPLNSGFYKKRFRWGVRKIETMDDNRTSQENNSSVAKDLGRVTASAGAAKTGRKTERARPYAKRKKPLKKAHAVKKAKHR